jgi:hypothetical protein
MRVLFDLWKDIKKLGSQDLIAKVSDLMTNIVIMLHKSAEFAYKLSPCENTTH